MYLPADYEARVYAGVLGKIIGVYLGRPFEGWTYEQISKRLGEINYYVHEKLNVPLIVTDDDISGTFTFLRAMPDYGNTLALTPAQIGQTWLNYLIEERTILWWGGLGNSTEHTAYLRLKNGIKAPQSGSIALNSKVVAEQIGAQIFIDGWAMIAPGDPQLAADLARRAGSVSHDGEAIYGAQVLAAMEAQAFVENDLNKLLDVGVAQIPHDSVIYSMIADLRELREKEPDWRKAREHLEAHYGYQIYGGNCHMVPNHGLMALSLLYGGDDFQKTMMIVNTGGWDTDCNSGNIGCLMGIKNGLAGLETGPDYRGPVADRLFLPTADGGRAISDALRESYEIINIGRALADKSPLAPKDGARYHFSLPGAVQGFMEEDSIPCKGVTQISNAALPGAETRAMKIQYSGVATGREGHVYVDTFIPPAYAHSDMHYKLMASPTLYSGQTLSASVVADPANVQPVQVGLYLRYYGAQDELVYMAGPQVQPAAGQRCELTWQIPDLGGQPIAQVGLALTSEQRADGVVYLDWLTWDGVPQVTFTRPAEGSMWRDAWINAVDESNPRYPEPFRLIQNSGVGMVSIGGRSWGDYTAQATISPHMANGAGLGVRVQGMKRYYALMVCADQTMRLVKALDGLTTLAEKPFSFEWDAEVDLKVTVQGSLIRAWVNGALAFEVNDTQPLLQGGVALVVDEGRMSCDAVTISA